MKKLITALALAASAAGAAQAQTTPSNTVGVLVGYGRTGLLGNNEYKPVSHSGYQAGLTADLYLSDALSFHPEALYTLQYFDATELALLSRDVTYVNVPLLARYHANGLFFEAGPEVNFALKAVNEGGENVKSQVNPVVLDYVVGLGYQLNNGPSIGVRYDGGASNVFKSDASTVLGRGRFKSSTVWLTLGYSFGGK